MKKRTLFSEFNEICNKLSECDAIGFAGFLRSFIYCLYSKGIINYNTVETLSDELRLNSVWNFIRENPDGTQSYYIDGELYDTYKPEELIEKVLRLILNDDYFDKNIEYASMQGLETILKSNFVTIEWMMLYRDLEKLYHPVFTTNRILWLESNRTGSYNLCSVRGNINKTLSINKKIIDVLYEGIAPFIAYDKTKECVYLKIYGMDAYVCYNLIEFSEEITYRKLISVDEAGNVKTEKRKKVSDITKHGKIGNFTYESGKLIMESTFINNGKVVDDIICCDNPHAYPGQVFFDRIRACYMIKWDDNNELVEKQIEEKFVKKYSTCSVERFDSKSICELNTIIENFDDEDDYMLEPIIPQVPYAENIQENEHSRKRQIESIINKIEEKIKQLEFEEYLDNEITTKLEQIKANKIKEKKAALGLNDKEEDVYEK